MPKYLIDTDTVSYAIRGASPSLRLRWKHATPEDVFISSITAAELLFGLKKYPLQHPLRPLVIGFLRSANIVNRDLPAAEAYADVCYKLTVAHALIGELGMMIAAHALSAGMILVGNNTRHFERLIPPLQLENWTAE